MDRFRLRVKAPPQVLASSLATGGGAGVLESAPAPRNMHNFFPEWTNSIPLKAALCLAAGTLAAGAGVAYYFTPKFTSVGYRPVQPIEFSHALHTGKLGMDCRFCHSSVEVAAHANLPTAQTCMACHEQILPESPKLEPLRRSWKSGEPIEWVRVHQLPDFAYFDHAAHVTRGVSCVICHGRVDEMDVVRQVEPLSMAWCLDCHRSPANALCPPAEVFRPPTAQSGGAGRVLEREWQVAPPLTCGGCHR